MVKAIKSLRAVKRKMFSPINISPLSIFLTNSKDNVAYYNLSASRIFASKKSSRKNWTFVQTWSSQKFLKDIHVTNCFFEISTSSHESFSVSAIKKANQTVQSAGEPHSFELPFFEQISTKLFLFLINSTEFLLGYAKRDMMLHSTMFV